MKVKPSPFNVIQSPRSNFSGDRHSKQSTSKYDVVALNEQYDMEPIVTRMDETAKFKSNYDRTELKLDPKTSAADKISAFDKQIITHKI